MTDIPNTKKVKKMYFISCQFNIFDRQMHKHSVFLVFSLVKIKIRDLCRDELLGRSTGEDKYKERKKVTNFSGLVYMSKSRGNDCISIKIIIL